MSLSDAWEQARQAWRRLAASSKRPSEDDDGLASLSDIGVVRRMLDQAELAAVRTARRHGKSWAEIATHLGVARQSAWERWRDLDDSLRGEPQLSSESTVLNDAAADLLADTRARTASGIESDWCPTSLGWNGSKPVTCWPATDWWRSTPTRTHRPTLEARAGSSPTRARNPARWSGPDRSCACGFGVTVTPESVNRGVRDPHRDRLARCCPNPATRPSGKARFAW